MLLTETHPASPALCLSAVGWVGRAGGFTIQIVFSIRQSALRKATFFMEDTDK
jgi:hypothetical protein